MNTRQCCSVSVCVRVCVCVCVCVPASKRVICESLVCKWQNGEHKQHSVALCVWLRVCKSPT